jgi:hypothetical protein
MSLSSILVTKTLKWWKTIEGSLHIFKNRENNGGMKKKESFLICHLIEVAHIFKNRITMVEWPIFQNY